MDIINTILHSLALKKVTNFNNTKTNTSSAEPDQKAPFQKQTSSYASVQTRTNSPLQNSPATYQENRRNNSTTAKLPRRRK